MKNGDVWTVLWTGLETKIGNERTGGKEMKCPHCDKELTTEAHNCPNIEYTTTDGTAQPHVMPRLIVPDESLRGGVIIGLWEQYSKHCETKCTECDMAYTLAWVVTTPDDPLYCPFCGYQKAEEIVNYDSE